MSENKATRYYPGRDWPVAKSQAQLVAEGNFETCCECGGETGKAGRGEDSLYCPECDAGPFCPRCYDNHMVGEYEPLVERLRAENANLKRLLDDANARAAQIEDWQIKCALLEVDRDRLREAVKTAMDFIDGRAPLTANEVGAQLEYAYEPYAPKEGTDAD